MVGFPLPSITVVPDVMCSTRAVLPLSVMVGEVMATLFAVTANVVSPHRIVRPASLVRSIIPVAVVLAEPFT